MVKQYRQDKTFQNKRKFHQQMEEDDMKTYQLPDARETKQFWTKIWQPREHNEKVKWINNMTKELEDLKEGPKV